MNPVPQYVDYAQYYDHDHRDTVPDFEFYLDYARQCGSPVLELACGTGRLLIPLAESGIEMTGVDLSENMLAVCKHKVEDRQMAERVTLVHASMADYDLPRKDFSLVFIAFRSFMHLYNQQDQLACLRRTFEHLRSGGTLIIDLYFIHTPLGGSLVTHQVLEIMKNMPQSKESIIYFPRCLMTKIIFGTPPC